jgi:hypothetical protein
MRSTYPVIVVLLGLLGGCIGTDFIDELPDEPMQEARIEVSPPSQALLQGQTAAFEAIFFGTNGQVRTGISFAWASSNPSIASVDAGGMVTALQAGQAFITATASGVSSPPAMLTVVADPNQVAQVVVVPDSVELALGSSERFTAMALNLSGGPVSNATFTWESSAPDVASIDGQGLARALKAGTTEVTATTGGVRSLPAVLRVPGQRRTGLFAARGGTNYTVRGTAILEEQEDGALVVRFEDNFATSSGPGLEVFLSSTSVVNAGSLNLGTLQSTRGAQSYRVGDRSVALDTYDFVVIHCVPFNVTFGAAQLGQ